jgi:hypothetical protein
LQAVNKDLHKLYEIICTCNGDKPRSNLLSAITKTDDNQENILNRPQLLNMAFAIQKNVDNLQDLIIYMKKALDKHLVQIQGNFYLLYHFSKTWCNHNFMLFSILVANLETNEMEGDQKEQIEILKVLLLKKCQQIVTFRQILKTEQQTATTGLNNIRSMYEHEKVVMHEQMAVLREEVSLMRIEIMNYSSKFKTPKGYCSRADFNFLLHVALVVERMYSEKLEASRTKTGDLIRCLVASEKQNQSLRLMINGEKDKMKKTKFIEDDENNKCM